VHVRVEARDWEFVLSRDTVPVGDVVFDVVNRGGQPHSFSILGRTTPVLLAGQSAALAVTFTEPGVYTYNSTADDVDREMFGYLEVVGSPATTARGSTLPLRRVADVPLPGGSSRFDYQSLDPKRHRLFIAHLGADAVIAFDVRTRTVARNVEGIASPHGVRAVPELNRAFASATGTHSVVAIDETTLRVVGRASAGSFPDGVAFDPVHRRLFVSDKTGGAEIVLDARRLRTLGRVALGGEAGNVQYDASGRRMLVAVAGRERLAALATARPHVAASWPLPGCAGAHGLLVDAPRRLAFVACEDNAKLLVFDLALGRVTSTFDVGTTPDVLAFDTQLRRLYVASESGTVTIFRERGRALSKLAEGFLAPGAHTVAVDSRTHLVYFPLENVDGKPVLRILAPA
jgi:DNA-binding beta-propeller fold protein YncE